MRHLLATLALGLALGTGFAGSASAQTPFRPVAVVNDSVITGYDLQQRARILSVLGFTAASEEALRTAALDALIEDRLKLQAGKRLGIEPTEELVEAGVALLAESAGTEPAALRTLLENQDVSALALRDLASAEAVWREVIRTRFSRRVDPGEAEIDSEIALLSGNSVSYRLQEIGLPAAASGEQTRALAEQIYRDVSQGGDFGKAVAQHSQSPSAQRGGELGWVAARNLPPDLAATLATLEAGQVTRPLPVPGGFSILKILDKRVESGSGVDAADPELREQMRRRMANERGALLAEGLLQELRRDALIELR